MRWKFRIEFEGGIAYEVVFPSPQEALRQAWGELMTSPKSVKRVVIEKVEEVERDGSH